MKKLILFILLIIITLTSFAQREVDANVVIVRDSININGDWIYIDAASDNQIIKRVSGRWVNTSLSSINTVLADSVIVDTLNGATYFSVQKLYDGTQSAGVIDGGAITDGGSGTINISAIKGIIKTTNSDIGDNVSFDLVAQTGLSLTDNSTNYIVVDYNSGVPQIVISTSSTANGHTIFNLGKVYREGTVLDIIDSGLNIYDWSKRVQQHHLDEAGLHFVSGATVGETGTRNITITAGVMYAGLNRIITDAVNTATGDDFEYYYYNGSVWIESSQTQINNLQYNNIASGLATLSNNQYGVHWVYKGTNGKTYVIYGQDTYTLDEAQNSKHPASLPDHVSEFGVLRARIIIRKSETIFTEIDNIDDSEFVGETASNHNDLANIDGGEAGYYGHTTLAELTKLQDSVFVYVDSVFTAKNTTFSSDSLNYTKDGTTYNVTEIFNSDGVKQGGDVTWQNGLIFNTSPCKYVINGDWYETTTALDTLATADATHPRIDIFVVDTLSAVSIITGTPSATPVKPIANPLSQLELTHVQLDAGATVPVPPDGGTLVDSVVYNENVEWTGTGSGVVVDFASATTPYLGDSCIDVGTIEPTGDYIKFVNSSSITVDFTDLSFFVKSKTGGASGRHGVYIHFLKSGVSVSNYYIINFSFDDTGWTKYNLDIGTVSFFDTEFDEVRFYYFQSPATSSIGFYLDYIKLQGGFSQPATLNALDLYVNDTIREEGISKLNLVEGYGIDLTYDVNGKVTVEADTTELATRYDVDTTNVAVALNTAKISAPNLTTQTLAETAGAITFNYLNGASDSTTIDQTTIITMSNVPDGGTGEFIIVQGDAGDDNVTFIHSGLIVKWRNDDQDLTDTSGAIDVISYKRALNTIYITWGENYTTQ